MECQRLHEMMLQMHALGFTAGVAKEVTCLERHAGLQPHDEGSRQEAWVRPHLQPVTQSCLSTLMLAQQQQQQQQRRPPRASASR